MKFFLWSVFFCLFENLCVERIKPRGLFACNSPKAKLRSLGYKVPGLTLTRIRKNFLTVTAAPGQPVTSDEAESALQPAVDTEIEKRVKGFTDQRQVGLNL